MWIRPKKIAKGKGDKKNIPFITVEGLLCLTVFIALQIWDMNWWTKGLLAFLASAALSASAWHLLCNYATPTRIIAVFVAGVIMMGLSASSVINQWKKDHPRQILDPIRLLLPYSALDVFGKDFDVLYRYQDTWLLNDPNLKGTFGVLYKICYDFDAKSKFLTFYIAGDSSRESASNSYVECSLLPNLCDSLVNQTRGNKFGTGHAGENTQWSDDLVFTRKVYVYYDGELSLSQLGQLEDMFKQKNLDVVFRGRSYATTRWLQDKDKLPSTPSTGVWVKTYDSTQPSPTPDTSGTSPKPSSTAYPEK